MENSPDRVSSTTLQQATERVAELMVEDAAISEDELSRTLVGEEFPVDVSERAIAFVPLAFGRKYLAADPPTYQAGFEIRDPETDQIFSGMLKDEHAFQVAMEIAETWYLEKSQEEFLRVAVRSAEIDAISQLTASGSRVSDLVLSEPIFLRIPLPADSRKRSPDRD